MNHSEEEITVSQNVPAARALEVVQMLIADDEGRRAYKAAPADAFDEKKRGLEEGTLREANYGDVPDNSRSALEALSVEELQVLSILDRTFVEDGLFVDVPSCGRLHYN
jgi:hypothetical protein